MDRYYEILTQTMDRLGRGDAAARQAVYARVRRQLDAILARQAGSLAPARLAEESDGLEHAIARFEHDAQAREQAARAAAEKTDPLPDPAPETSLSRPAVANTDLTMTPVGEIPDGYFRTALPPRRRLSPGDHAASKRVRRLALGVAGPAAAVILLAGIWLVALSGPEGAPADAVPDTVVPLFSDTLPDGLAAGSQASRITVDGAARITDRLVSPPSAEPPFDGISVPIDGETEQRASGRVVRVWVVARQAPDGPAATLSARYATIEQGASDPHAFRLDDSYRAYDFVFDVPSRAGGDMGDALLLWTTPDGGAVDIRFIGLDILDG